MRPGRLSLAHGAFLALLLLAVPVAVFHAVSGRPAQGAMAIGAAVVGMVVLRELLREQRDQTPNRSFHPPQPVQTVFVPPLPVPAPRAAAAATPRPSPRHALEAGIVALAAQVCVLLLPLALAASVGDAFAPLLQRWAALFAPGLAGEPLRRLALPTLLLVLSSAIPLAWLIARLAWPRLPGTGWLRGATCALGAWLVAGGVWSPLAGAGVFGLGLGAGPLPALVLLASYLAYGATLGVALGGAVRPACPHGRQPERPPPTADRGAAGGALVGLALGLGGGIAIAEAGRAALPPPPALVITAVALIGCSWGVLLGSVVAQRDEAGGAFRWRRDQAGSETLEHHRREREPRP